MARKPTLVTDAPTDRKVEITSTQARTIQAHNADVAAAVQRLAAVCSGIIAGHDIEGGEVTGLDLSGPVPVLTVRVK